MLGAVDLGMLELNFVNGWGGGIWKNSVGEGAWVDGVLLYAGLGALCNTLAAEAAEEV